MEITLTEALSKVKLYEKKIEKLISEIRNKKFLLADIATGTSNIEKPLELSKQNYKEFEKLAQAKIDKINDYLDLKAKLQGLISQANAVSKVIINNKEYTIHQAISRKRNIDTEKEVLEAILSNFGYTKRVLDKKQEETNAKIESLLDTNLSSDAKNKDNTSNVYKELLSIYSVNLIDPLNIENYIQDKYDEIEAFELEVDTKLNIANATTLITID